MWPLWNPLWGWFVWRQCKQIFRSLCTSIWCTFGVPFSQLLIFNHSGFLNPLTNFLIFWQPFLRLSSQLLTAFDFKCPEFCWIWKTPASSNNQKTSQRKISQVLNELMDEWMKLWIKKYREDRWCAHKCCTCTLSEICDLTFVSKVKAKFIFHILKTATIDQKCFIIRQNSSLLFFKMRFFFKMICYSHLQFLCGALFEFVCIITASVRTSCCNSS